MSTSQVAGIDYREITNNDDVPFERDPRESTKFGGAVDGVKPTQRFATSFHGEGKYVQKTLKLDLSETEDDSNARARRLFHQEVKNLHHARHQHVIDITMAYFFEDEEEAYFAIIMPRADGNLKRFMERMTSPDSTKKKLVSRWFGCLANVTEFIHGIGIRHRDVKPENILYKGKKVLFADFGISKMGLGKTLSTTVPQWMRTATPKYVAPEVGDGSTRGRSADIFSLGTVFLEMLLAHSYPHERSKLKRKISGEGGQSYSKRLASVRTCMDELQIQADTDGELWKKAMLDLCREMLQEDRERRPSAERVHSVVSSMPQSDDSPGPCGCTSQETLSEAQRLVEACKKGGGLEEVKSLLRNQDTNTIGAIHQAAAHGFQSIVQTFIDENVDINLTDHSGQTALHCAAGYGHEVVVDLLLRHGAKVYLKDDEGQTPIHCAAGQGRLNMLKMLLRQDAQGTSVAIENIYGQTALHSAARKGNFEVVQVILQKMTPADVAKPDGKKQTALHLAAGCGSEEVTRMLLDRLAPELVDSQDDNGWTPLHFATRGKQAGGKYLEVVQLLLSRGADRQICDIQGNSPYFYADKNQQPDIAKPLMADDHNQVSDQLHTSRHLWERATRIQTVLRAIDVRPNVLPMIMDRFVSCGITDFRLPLKGSDIGHILAPGTCARFEKEQENVLTTTFRCEELGEHGSLRTDNWQSSWEPIGKLGEGNSGAVHKVKSSDTGKIFALKLIRRGAGDEEARAEDELNLLKRVTHNHIISLVGSFTSPSFFGLLMVPAAQYNLERYLSEAVVDPEKRRSLWGYFGCLVEAVCHLHNTAYVRHNDIKPQNILVDDSHVLLTDFGISLDWSETLRTTTFGPAAMTPMYSAPEVTGDDQSRNTFSDIWSLGCVFLEMITVLMGRSVHDLRQYLNEQSITSSAYSKNLFHLRRWIVILKANLDGSKEQLLGMIENMIAENLQSRPTANKLRREILDFDSRSKQSFFGDCCKAKSCAEMELNITMPQEEIAEKFPIEQHTNIAAVSWTGEQRLFVQGTDGTIRQVSRREGLSWRGGKMNDTIATGRLCTPIAATAWRHISGHRQPTIRVYFLDEDSYIRERTWDPISEWADGALPRRFRAASFSQLAVTSWNEGNTILYYQSEDRTIHTLHGWAKEERWMEGSTHMGASAGCSLAALNFEHFGHRGVRLYYESEDSMIREACWDSIHDKYRNDASPFLGGYRLPISMGSFVSGVAWKYEDLDMRLYLGGKEGIFEHRYTGGWPDWYTHLENLLPERQISVLRGDSGSVHIYFVEGKSIVEAQRSRGATTRTPILSKLVCSGPECPGNLGQRVPHSHHFDGISRPPIESAATEVDGRPADEMEVDGQGAGIQESDGQANHGQENFPQEGYGPEVELQGYVAHEHIEQEVIRPEVHGQDGDRAAGRQPDQQESDSTEVHGRQSVDVEPIDEEHTTVVPASQAECTNADGQAQQQPPCTNILEAEVNTQPPQDGGGLSQGESGWLRFQRQWKQRVARYCCYCC